MSDIQPGDVVVCVDAKLDPRSTGWGWGVKYLREGHYYSVVECGLSAIHKEPVVCLQGILHGGELIQFLSRRFRKLRADDEPCEAEFTALVKKPLRQPVKA